MGKSNVSKRRMVTVPLSWYIAIWVLTVLNAVLVTWNLLT